MTPICVQPADETQPFTEESIYDRVPALMEVPVNVVAKKAAVLFILVFLSFKSFGDDYYFVMLFSEGIHTHASFIKASGEGDDVSTYRLERHDINWGADGDDQNRKTEYSLKKAASERETVRYLGPVQILPALYEAAKKQIALLENNDSYKYRLLDGNNRTLRQGKKRGINCIHAISDIISNFLGGGYLRTGLNSGEKANRQIFAYFQPWIARPKATYLWVGQRLGFLSKP